MAIFRPKRDQSRRLVRLTPEARDVLDAFRKDIESSPDLPKRTWTDAGVIAFACLVAACDWTRAVELFNRSEVAGEPLALVTADFEARNRAERMASPELVRELQDMLQQRDRELTERIRKAGYAAGEMMLLQERVRDLEAKLADRDK